MQHVRVCVMGYEEFTFCPLAIHLLFFNSNATEIRAHVIIFGAELARMATYWRVAGIK